MLSFRDQRIFAFMEKTPPGYEPVVRALKRKGNIDNPWAVAWAMKNRAGKKTKTKACMNSDEALEWNKSHSAKTGQFTSPKKSTGGKKKSTTPKAPKAPKATKAPKAPKTTTAKVKKPRTKKVKASATSSGFNALLRSGHKEDTMFKCSVTESAQVISSPPPTSDLAADGMEGQKVLVVLISEGLGNRRDMNYYGPEAMDSAPFAFEGAHCFLNHPSYSEEQDIPERRVQDVCGYFKNVRVDVMEGRRCVLGELHFDLSDTGRMGYSKMCTALHYQTEFPGADKEYVGLSVNADGESEPRDIALEGETVTVHYVTRFTNARSTDIVTLPARGGKALALVESAAGADMKNKEVRTMIVKRLQAAQSRLKEAISLTQDSKQKKLLQEALAENEALLKDALDAANRSRTQEAEDESETESETEEESEDEMESEDEDDAPVPPGHKITKTVTKKIHHTADDASDADDGDDDKEDESETESETYEANRLAVKHLIAESGLEKELFDEDDLAKRGIKEAKREIKRMKRVSEAWTRRAMKVMGDISPAHAAKFNESGRRENPKSNMDLFAGCSK